MMLWMSVYTETGGRLWMICCIETGGHPQMSCCRSTGIRKLVDVHGHILKVHLETGGLPRIIYYIYTSI